MWHGSTGSVYTCSWDVHLTVDVRNCNTLHYLRNTCQLAVNPWVRSSVAASIYFFNLLQFAVSIFTSCFLNNFKIKL